MDQRRGGIEDSSVSIVNENRDEADDSAYEWEYSKENVVPIREGRNVTKLNKILAHNTEKLQSFKDKYAEQMEEFEAAIENYRGKDPLELCVRYVKWLRANQATNTAKLLQMLERFIRMFKDEDGYKQDIRFLRFWISYADLVKNPKDIFKFMYKNKIGTKLGLFYVAWAWITESSGNFAQADKIYQIGLQIGVVDDNVLVQKQKEFQRRMARHWLNAQIHHDIDENDKRKALGALSKKGVSSTFRTTSVKEKGLPELANANKKSEYNTTGRNNNKIPVFVEQDFARNTSSHEEDEFQNEVPWNELPTQSEGMKENYQSAGKWNQGGLTIQGKKINDVVCPESVIDVYVDEELEDKPTYAHLERANKETKEPSFRKKIESDRSELLSRKPMVNFEISVAVETVKGLDGVGRRDEILMYSKDALICDRDELSFEEVRAKDYRVDYNLTVVEGLNKIDLQGLEYSTIQCTPIIDTNTNYTGSESVTIRRKLNFPDSASRSSNQMSKLDIAADENITINTRIAISDINNMFCSPDASASSRKSNSNHSKVAVDNADPDINSFKPFTEEERFIPSGNTIPIFCDKPADREQHSEATKLEGASKSAVKPIFKDTSRSNGDDSLKSGKNLSRNPLGERRDIISEKKTYRDILSQLEEEKKDIKSGLSVILEQSCKTLPNSSICFSPRESLINTYSNQKSCGKRQSMFGNISPIAETHPIAPIVIENRERNIINPFEKYHRSQMIKSEVVAKLLLTSPNVHIYDMLFPGNMNTIFKSKTKEQHVLPLVGGWKCIVGNCLGKGAFGNVFLTLLLRPDGVEVMCAAKHESPVHHLPWEFYIYRELYARSEQVFYFTLSELSPPTVEISSLEVFMDGACYFMRRSVTGTLMDLINHYNTSGKKMPEEIVMYYTIKMLSAIEQLHSADIIHGDVKPDNWLVDSAVLREKEECIMTGDIRLIDFGRSIDMKLYPSGTVFCGSCHTSGFQCVEMQCGSCWTKQVDTYGICGTIHCMLFGAYMEVKPVSTNCTCANKNFCPCLKRWEIKKQFKRYWEANIWSKLFDGLLNIKDCNDQPCLKQIRRPLESYLRQNVKHLEELLRIQDRFVSALD